MKTGYASAGSYSSSDLSRNFTGHSSLESSVERLMSCAVSPTTHGSWAPLDFLHPLLFV